MKVKFYLSLILCLFVSAAWSQSRTITGRVLSDSSRDGLGGVTVTVKGTRISTTTATDGRYSIAIPINGRPALVFTYVGVAPQEVVVGTKPTVDVTLASTSAALDVVVIGYQTVRRRDLLASVASVGAKDLKDIPINSAAEALNGRLAGVTATTAEGSPDAQVRIRVRGGMSITGDNNPLFIVDGVQVENALSVISPQDIQSVDVLKDAAATAIYGARGGNGVVVITTKSGRPGRTVVSYGGFIGVRTLAKELKVLSPYEYVLYQSERSRGSMADSTNFTKNFGTTWDTLSNYRNVPAVDWQDEVFGNTGIQSTHNVSASGGTQKVTYNFSYTYNYDKPVVQGSNFQRHLLNGKVDYKIMKNLKVGATGRYTNQEVLGAGVSSEQGASYSRLRNAVRYRPFLSQGQELTDTDPLADPNVGNGLNLVNPILLSSSEYRRKSTESYNFTANLSYTIIKNLSFRSVVGYDKYHLVDRQFYDSITPYATIQGGRKPVASLDTTERTTLTNSNVLNYSIKGYRNVHDLDILVGEETYDLKTTSQSSLFKNYPAYTSFDNAFKQTQLGTSFAGYPQLGKTRYTNLSFFGSFKYGYKDKYLIGFNVRRDGASKFGPGHKYGTFPAGSVAWRIKRESFLKNASFIGDLKIRAGYGLIGNNRINDYLFLTTFSNNGRYYYGLNNQSVIAYYPTSLVNQDLKWESTLNKNLGLDVSMFKGRLDLSFDVYQNNSKDLLLQVPIASTYGYTTQFQNIGKTSNKGFEVQVTGGIIRHPNGLNWTASLNVSHNTNKIVALGTNQASFLSLGYPGVSGQPSDYIQRIGSPVGSMYGYVTDGFYGVNDFDYNTATSVYTLKTGTATDVGVIGPVQPGSIRFRDLNGDGKIDDNDKTIIGNPTPKFTGGLNQQFSYKNWDASLFVNFSYGNDIFNANKLEFTNGYTNNGNLLEIMQNRWRTVTADGRTAQYVNGSNQVVGLPPAQLAALNANATIWQPLKAAGAFVPHSWAIEDGSFLRINNVTIGYSVPVKRSGGFGFSRLRFYATGNNLAVLTSYSGYDPEVSVRNSALTPGLDYSAYPKSRTYIFGVNASF